jgi:hypothetical protein
MEIPTRPIAKRTFGERDMRTLGFAAAMLLASTLIGCSEPAPEADRAGEPAQSAPAQPIEAPQAAPSATAPSNAVETVREKAAVGMSEKGRDYGKDPIATPVSTLWSVKEQLVLIQIQSALQLYKAADSDGRGPRNHKEFMEKIVRANDIRLPKLPSGHRYVYDPAKEELMVEKPKQP